MFLATCRRHYRGGLWSRGAPFRARRSSGDALSPHESVICLKTLPMRRPSGMVRAPGCHGFPGVARPPHPVLQSVVPAGVRDRRRTPVGGARERMDAEAGPMIRSSEAAARAGWSRLGARARSWRIAHATWSVAQLGCLALMWHRVFVRRRDRATWLAAGLIAVEGGALVVGRGNCPMGAMQEEWGDPVPFFELLLPPRAAKAAIPVLAVLSGLAIAGLMLRTPGLVTSTPVNRAKQPDRRARGPGVSERRTRIPRSSAPAHGEHKRPRRERW